MQFRSSLRKKIELISEQYTYLQILTFIMKKTRGNSHTITVQFSLENFDFILLERGGKCIFMILTFKEKCSHFTVVNWS